MRMDMTYRVAREEDLPAMRLAQGLAVRDLAARLGQDPAVFPLDDQPTPPMRYLLRSSPGMSWVAIRDSKVVGFSQGFVRGDLWFLSNLFVDPQAQHGGTGATLLQKCLQAGVRRGATVRAVSSSPELAAQALYARAGMIAHFPLFVLQGRVDALRTLPPPRVKTVQPSLSGQWIDALAALDEYAWGMRRDRDHRFAQRELKLGCAAIGSAQNLAGYAYYCPEQIGPVAARTPRIQLNLLRAAGDALAEGGAKRVRLTVPGINATVLTALLEAGFRIMFSNLFMASRLIGRFDRYLPSGGTLL
jgi:ribosomal protein S18 acetylase RimI-like enzyme